MHALINDQHRRINSLKAWIQEYREHCITELTNQHFRMLEQHIQQTTERTNQHMIEVFRRRMDTLRQLKDNNSSRGLVCNLSTKTLTYAQLALLQRDAGYNLTDAGTLDFVAALEPALSYIRVGEEIKSSLKQQVTGLIMNHRRYQTLSRSEKEALGQLRKDDSIVILPADKGRATVVMDKVTYVNKALELLNDTTAYKVVSKDPTTTLRNHTNKLLDELKRKGRISEEVLRRVRPNDSALARFYGLPKIHKQNVPLRPIVAFRGTPISELAKWLSNRISHLANDSDTTVRSAEEFLDKIRALKVEEDEIMVSFDVVSLFTSIPQDLAVAVLRDRLDQGDSKQQQDSLQTEDLIRLVGICLKTYFTFQGTIFEQIKGTPMGSPISSVIAELVLQQLERIVMARYQPKFWAHYVDDTFVIIKKQHKAGFMGILNSVCPDIQFTMEEECQGSLAFLDVLIQRQQDGTLDTRVYRKSTCTDRILHYGSNHPAAHKASCIRTLFRRVESHCSTARAKKEERNYLFRICKRNGYPTRFIRRHSIPSGPRGSPLTEGPVPQTTYVTLPYICNVSEATARLLAPFNVKVAHKPNQTLRAAIMRPKDPLPDMEKSAVVYRLDCMDCPSNYVGETSKRVKTRVHEHRLAVKRGEQRSQVWTHMAESGHHFNFNEVRVLASDNTKGGRLLKEAWLSNGDSINRRVDLCPAHLALRSWSVGSRLSRCRQFGDIPEVSTSETRKERSTPQRAMNNVIKREQDPGTITTPRICTRLQRAREAVGNRIQNPSIKDIQGTSLQILGDTRNENEKRGQYHTTISHLHPKRRGMIDPGTSRWPSNLRIPIQLEPPAQMGLGVNNDLESRSIQGGRIDEELEEGPWREDLDKVRTYNNLINTPLHPAASPLVDPNGPQNNGIRMRNIRGKRGVGSNYDSTRDDRNPPPSELSGHRVRRGCRSDDEREMEIGREENHERNGDLTAQTPHSVMPIERDGLEDSSTQMRKADEELEDEPRKEEPYRGHTNSSLMSTHPCPVTPTLVESGDPRDSWARAGCTGGRREMKSECDSTWGDRNLPPPDLCGCGIRRRLPDENEKEGRIALNGDREGSGDVIVRAVHHVVLARGDHSETERRLANEWGGERDEGEARIEQESARRAHPSENLNSKPTHLVTMTQLDQGTMWDHPKNNKQEKTPNEGDDPHRNEDRTKKDREERRGGGCRSFKMFAQKSEEGDRNKQRDLRGVSLNLKLDGGGIGKVIHTNVKRKKKPSTEMQVMQLGPVTRSRSRAQNLTN